MGVHASIELAPNKDHECNAYAARNRRDDGKVFGDSWIEQ